MTDKMCSVFAAASAKAGMATSAAILSAAVISNSPVSAAERWPTADEMQKLKYLPWSKSCFIKGSGSDAQEVCVTSKFANTEGGQLVFGANVIDTEGEAKKWLTVLLPQYADSTSVDIAIAIDKEPAVRSMSFRCFANWCRAHYEATSELVDKLKKGETLQIHAVPSNLSADALIFALPLADGSGNSFIGASEGPPAHPSKRCNLDTLHGCQF
jgi:invasion protein IalB